jgi:hypothetical protein
MFWKRNKQEQPETLDIAGLINEGAQQGKVYTTSCDGRLKEVGSYETPTENDGFSTPVSG